MPEVGDNGRIVMMEAEAAAMETLERGLTAEAAAMEQHKICLKLEVAATE